MTDKQLYYCDCQEQCHGERRQVSHKTYLRHAGYRLRMAHAFDAFFGAGEPEDRDVTMEGDASEGEDDDEGHPESPDDDDDFDQIDSCDVAERGPARQAQGLNMLFTFAEDENGTCLSGFTMRAMNATAREIWQELKKRGKAPKTWLTGTPTSVRNFYRVEMYRRHPELRLCENNWKVDFIASHSYPGWSRRHLLGKIVKGEESSDDPPISTLPQKRAALTSKSSAHPKKLKVPTAPKPKAGPKPVTEVLDTSTETVASSSETKTSPEPVSPATPTSSVSPVCSDASLQLPKK